MGLPPLPSTFETVPFGSTVASSLNLAFKVAVLQDVGILRFEHDQDLAVDLGWVLSHKTRSGTGHQREQQHQRAKREPAPDAAQIPDAAKKTI